MAGYEVKLKWETLDYTDTGISATVLDDGEVAVLENVPGYQAADRAVVVGDGVSTIDQLIGRANGVVIRALTVDAAIAVGKLCYLDGAGEMNAADNTVEASTAGLLGICIAKDGTDGLFLLRGVWETTGLTVGSRYYVGTAGAIAATSPSGSGEFVRVVGIAISATELLFAPSVDYLEIA